ncbi:MAG: MFS transporter [Solirubrobacteraceae bacterium]
MSTNIISPSPPAPAADRMTRALASNRWAPLAVVLTGTFVVVLDFFIVNVALPSMQAHLHASSGALEWVVAGYGLTSAVFLVTAGRLGDRFGRRRMFMLGLELFTLSSALCGIAPSPGVLIVGRLLQGLGGALLMPNVLSLISVLYVGENRARALAAYGMVMGLAAAGGQLIGGALVQWNPAGLDWRSCFLINLPIGAAGIVFAAKVIPESRSPKAGPIDLPGTVLLSAALTSIVLPLVEGRTHGWPLWTWLMLASSPLLLAAFIAQQRRRHRNVAAGRSERNPLLTLNLFRRRTFSAGIGLQGLFWSGQASFFLVLALYLQQGRRLSPLEAGLVFTALALAYLGTSAIAPVLTVKHGRRALAIGALILAAGHALTLATVAVIGTGGSVLVLIPGLMVIGAGMGLGIAPLASIALSEIPPADAGSASGTLATMQNVGTAIGVAVIGVVYFGAVGSGVAGAFELSLAVLCCALLSVAALTMLLPTMPAKAANGASI